MMVGNVLYWPVFFYLGIYSFVLVEQVYKDLVAKEELKRVRFKEAKQVVGNKDEIGEMRGEIESLRRKLEVLGGE